MYINYIKTTGKVNFYILSMNMNISLDIVLAINKWYTGLSCHFMKEVTVVIFLLFFTIIHFLNVP